MAEANEILFILIQKNGRVSTILSPVLPFFFTIREVAFI